MSKDLAMKFAIVPEPTLLQRMSERLYQLVFKRDVDFIEALMGLLMLAWGLQLLLPPWGMFASSPSFDVLVAVWPHTETGWGALFVAFGTIKILGYLLDWLPLRIVASLLVSSAWSFVAGAIGYESPFGTGVVMYVGAATASSWVFWRLVARIPWR